MFYWFYENENVWYIPNKDFISLSNYKLIQNICIMESGDGGDDEYIYYCSNCEYIFQNGIKDWENYALYIMIPLSDDERKCNFCDKIGYCRQYHKDEYDEFNEIINVNQ